MTADIEHFQIKINKELSKQNAECIITMLCVLNNLFQVTF